MSGSCKSWIDRLQFSTLYWPPPQDVQQRQAQVMAYVEYFGQFTLERFPEDISELIQKHYPNKEICLLDDVLATFVLHHPEHGHAVVHPILSCIIEGTLLYDKSNPPFSSFISLFSPSSEKGYSEPWALACGEILRVLTHYNRPIYKVDHQNSETDRSSSGSHATTSNHGENDGCHPFEETERKPLRPLSPWITDVLLAAPLGIRSDYFRWCGGVMGKYAAGGELKPPTACGRGSGKHPQLMPSTPRWAVANGAGVILSVCDEEVARYETANLTAAAVPALLLPPPTSLDEHLVAGLPALEPYARLFHCYYAIATPSATQRLLLGLLEAPASWAPDALDAAVQLVELLRTAEDYADGMRLPRNWMHLHFLQAIGTAMSMREGIVADAAAALLFRVLSQPTLLFPRLNHAEATIEATAQGIASLLYAHGPEVERRICTIWEAAYGLLRLSSSTVDLPEIVVATQLQPPVLSWNLYLPFLKVLEYLPQGSPSEACLMRIFVATVKAILQRTFPLQSSREQTRWSRHLHGGIGSKSLAVTELHTMVNSLFVEIHASEDLASRLLFVVLTLCISHEAVPKGSEGPAGADIPSPDEIEQLIINGKHREVKSIKSKTQCPVTVFDSYILAAVCALACELQMFPSLAQTAKNPDCKDSLSKVVKINGCSHELRNGIYPAVSHICRILGILEILFLLKPSTVSTLRSYSSNEIVAAAMVAGHISELFGRSKACMHALSVLMRCTWDNNIYTRASSLYHLIDPHGKTVASMIDRAEPLEANAPLRKKATRLLGGKRQIKSPTDFSFGSEDSSCLRSIGNNESEIFLGRERTLLLTDVMLSTSGKSIASLPVNASDLAIFFTMDRNIGFNYQNHLRSMLSENQEICVSVVFLLWHKLIASPEIQISVESTSAQQGWRQVVDALCNVVMASATNVSMAVILQAERHLHHWISRDDEQGQKMWRINQRIVNLIVELMRNCDTPESLLILASASDLLLCATDGILIDGEASTLPRLEILTGTVMVAHLWTVDTMCI